MTFDPAYQTRFIEPALRNFLAIAEEDADDAVDYYNAQADGTAVGLTVEKFKRYSNTRFYELFFDARNVEYPVFIAGPDESGPSLENNYVEGSYSLLCEVWVAGSDPQLLKRKLARYETVVRMMYVTAGLSAPERFVAGAVVEPHAGVELSLGKARYRPVKAQGPNFYQDMTSIPFTLTYLEG